MAVLSVSDLSVSYAIGSGHLRALRSVSFELEKGASLGILGESGCGKTTLALALLRVLPDNATIDGGQVLYDNQDLTSASEETLRSVRWKGISMIFQAAMNSFSPVHRIGDQIAETLELHEKMSYKQAKARVAEMYELVGISNALIDSYPHEYSGGMRQRAVIAMALACNPNLIIADEPTTALDVLVQLNILKELRKIQEERGMSIIYISHDVGVISQVSDYVAVMYAGRIIEYGKTEEVLKNPQHPYSQALMDSSLSISGDKRELVPLEGEPPNLIEIPQGCSFKPRCQYADDQCLIEPLERQSDASWCLCWRPGVAANTQSVASE